MSGFVMKNINSSYPPDDEMRLEMIGNTEFLSQTAIVTPVYFVNEQLMDKIYPPERRKLLNPECVNEIKCIKKINIDDDMSEEYTRMEYLRDPFDALESKTSEIEKCWRMLSECERATDYIFHAAGVYVKSLNWDVTTKMINQLDELLIKITEPVIFICPERIKKWSESLADKIYGGQNFNRIYKTMINVVFIHELTHAYMATDRQRYQKPWGRVIEESLANLVAYQLSKGNVRRGIANIAMGGQPLEYCGFIYFIGLKIWDIKKMLRAWSEGNPHLIYPQLIAPQIFSAPKRIERYYSGIIDYPRIYPPASIWQILAMNIIQEIMR